MEQIVWFYIGIIIVIIALAGLISLLGINNEQVREQAGQNALTRIKRMCNFVCNSAPDTLLDIDVEFASGSLIDTNNDFFCIAYNKQDCIQCDCELEPMQLDLNTEEARQLFVTNPYQCYFEKKESGSVSVECRG